MCVSECELSARKLLYVIHFKVYLSCLALYKEANLTGGKRHLYACVRVYVLRFQVFLFCFFKLMTKLLFMINVYGQIVLIKCNI